MTDARLPAIAITTGDPAGVGPEIALAAAADPAVRACCRPVLIGHRALLARVGDRLHLPLCADIVEPELAFAADAVAPGKVQADCGAAGAAYVELAADGCRDGRFAAMATCPLNKQALAAGGVPYPGHTELLAARLGVAGDEVMLMYDDAIAVALVTIHQALASVPAAIAPAKIVHVGKLLAAALARLRGRPARLAVLGLNPHAGEGGLFGDEERAIVPAVYELLQLGIDTEGPLPPDTAFTPANRARFDGYVCMYHDQGLIPFKALAFAEGVNVTLGLPITRTSVDHGTAFDIAWSGFADHRNLVAAVKLAARLAT